MKKEITNKLLINLKDKNPEIRRKAIERLGPLGKEPKVRSAIIESLEDNDWRVRKTAASVILDLSRSRKEEILDCLLSSLDSSDAGKRNAVIEVLTNMGASAVQSLIRTLSTENKDVKKFVIDILGDIGDKRATESIINALKDTDENVHIAAIEALGKLKDNRAVIHLIPLLKEKDPLLSYSSIKALESIGDHRAVRPLIKIIKAESTGRAAIEALGAIGDGKALPHLLSILRTGSKRTKESVIKAMSSLYDKIGDDEKKKIVRSVKKDIDHETIFYLISILEDGVSENLFHAIRILGWVGEKRSVPYLLKYIDGEMQDETIAALDLIGKEAVEPLINALPKSNEIARAAIIRVLGTICDKGRALQFLLFLGDDNGHVRQATALALGKIGEKSVARSLLGLLEDPYPDVREAAVTALGQLKDEGITDTLIKMLSHDNAMLRANAAKVLGRMESKDAIESLSFALKDEAPEVRRAAVEAIGYINSEKKDGILMPALVDEDPAVRLSAISIIGKKKNRSLIPILLPLLQDEDIWVRAAAIKKIGDTCLPPSAERAGTGRIGSEEVIDHIVKSLSDDAAPVRIAAIEALCKIGGQKVIERLLPLLSDPDREIRKVSIDSLGELNDIGTCPLPPMAIGFIIKALEDENWDVRVAAVRALGKIKDPSAEERLYRLSLKDTDYLVRKSAHFALEQIKVSND